MSKEDLSADTEVVLLLCGRFGGEKQEAYQPLAPKEYGELAKWLKALALRPSDLLTDAGRVALSSVQEARLERQRVEFLLGRGTAMALALERWARGGLWVISRGDEAYPQRLKRRLKNAAPPLLYGAGDKALLDKGGLAIIGSRAASESALSFTRGLGARCANEGLAVVSGGARGVDAAAMQGATEAGGYCIGVLPSDLLKTSVNRQNRIGLQEGRLVLVSPFYPEAGFNAGNAMGRNRYIYTLADHALVINSALRSGGTWQGAIENLKHGWVPLYVRTPGEGDGNAALVAEGALPFALTPDSPDTLIGLFGAQAVSQPLSGDETADAQQSLLAPELSALAEAAPAELAPTSVQEELAVQPTLPSPHLFRRKRNCRRSQDLRHWRCIRPQPPICWRGLLLRTLAVPRARRLMSQQRPRNLYPWAAAASLWICMPISATSWNLCWVERRCQKKKLRRSYALKSPKPRLG